VPQSRPAEADAHIHPNTCHYVKALLAAALEGETPQLAGFVVANSCDGMRRLHDVWSEYVPRVPAFFLDVPKKRDPDAIALFASELRRLAEALERQLPSAGVSDERLEDAIRTCNAIRREMSEVLALQKEAAPRVGGRDFVTV
jgi:benzoyl-CoA reductase/2-hydroxyglutaryl-CoA dehydratase subunit BcrC/BadD/HgdB